MKIQVQEFKTVVPFLKVLDQVNQEKDPKQIPVKDLTSLLEENSYLINSTKLSSNELVGLDHAFAKLKTRFSTKVKGEEATKVLKAIKEFHLFKTLKQPSEILAMLKNCKGQLHEIDLSQNLKISDEIIREIPNLFPKLESLSVRLISKVKPESFIALKKLQNLKNLKIRGFIGLDANTMIEKVISQLQNLENLHLGSCEDVTEEGIKPIINLKNLKKLTVNGENITEKGLSDVVDKMKNLTKVNLHV